MSAYRYLIRLSLQAATLATVTGKVVAVKEPRCRGTPRHADWEKPMCQLRKYTLKDRKSLDFSRNVVYPRHFVSFAKFGMAIRGIWTAHDPVHLTLHLPHNALDINPALTA